MIYSVLPALSIRQPWAWLIVNGYKDIENRDWSTRFRGDFLVHAGKAMDDMSLEEIIRYYDMKGISPSKVELFRGGIIGRATLVDCVSKSESKWFHGQYGFKLANPTTLPFMPCRGHLGFFKPMITDETGMGIYS